MFIMGSSASELSGGAAGGTLTLAAPFARKVQKTNPSGSRQQGMMSCINPQYIVWLTEDQTNGVGGERDHIINYTNASGIIQASKVLNDPASSAKIQAKQAISDGISTYFVAVASTNVSDLYVCRTDNAGNNVNWARRFTSPISMGNRKLCCIAENTNNIFFVFYSGTGSATGHTYVICLSKTNGAVQWTRRQTNVGIFPYACVADETGVYIADYNNHYVLKLLNNGTLSWQTQPDYIGNEMAGIAILDGALVISGEDRNQNQRVEVIWLDPNSGALLHKKHADLTVDSTDLIGIPKVAIMPQNSAIGKGTKGIVAMNLPSSSSDIIMIEIDNVGNIPYGWYDLSGTSEKYVDNLAIDDDGNFIMFGNTDGANQWIVTVTDDRQIPSRMTNALDGDIAIAEADHTISTPTNTNQTDTISSTPVTLTLDTFTLQNSENWTS